MCRRIYPPHGVGPSRGGCGALLRARGEDTADASFAGMYDTSLNVVGDERTGWWTVSSTAGSRCTAERVIAYRVPRVDSRPEPAMAVVVQELVDADRAGVMFTADPATNNKDTIIIEAGFGLGEVLNGGEVEPDSYTVAKHRSRLRQVRVGYKSHRRGIPGEIERRHTRVELGLDESRSRVCPDRTTR